MCKFFETKDYKGGYYAEKIHDCRCTDCVDSEQYNAAIFPNADYEKATVVENSVRSGRRRKHTKKKKVGK